MAIYSEGAGVGGKMLNSEKIWWAVALLLIGIAGISIACITLWMSIYCYMNCYMNL